MNKSETTKLLAYIAIAYPNGKVEPNEPTVNLWAQFMADLPYTLAKSAVDSMIATLRFPPTIADIREAVARSMAEARGELTPGEAWGRVLAAVRKYGDNDERQVQKAREAIGDDLWEAVRLIGGWAYLCNTDDDVSTISAQFERRYKAMQEQAKYRVQVPQAVQDHLKALGAGQGLKMIGGGENS